MSHGRHLQDLVDGSFVASPITQYPGFVASQHNPALHASVCPFMERRPAVLPSSLSVGTQQPAEHSPTGAHPAGSTVLAGWQPLPLACSALCAVEVSPLLQQGCHCWHAGAGGVHHCSRARVLLLLYSCSPMWAGWCCAVVHLKALWSCFCARAPEAGCSWGGAGLSSLRSLGHAACCWSAHSLSIIPLARVFQLDPGCASLQCVRDARVCVVE